MSWIDDIIFEKRNKAYGAYKLRRNYSRVLALSLLAAVFVFVTVFLVIRAAYPALQKNDQEVFYVYNLNDSGIPFPPENKVPLMPPGGRNSTPEGIPRVTDSATSVDTLVNTADGNSNDTTGSGSGSGTGDGQVFYSVQQPPVYPGGDAERIKFLQRNIRVPFQARKNNIRGKVYISFIVEKDGQITNIKLVKGIGFGCDEEAMRVIRSMPPWIPGRQNGASVRVHVNWPIVF